MVIPSELVAKNPVAHRKWQEIREELPTLDASGHVILEQFCLNYARWFEVERELAAGALATKGSVGNSVKNPLAQLSVDLAKAMLAQRRQLFLVTAAGKSTEDSEKTKYFSPLKVASGS